ncbi:MAG TPA: porin [Burkholderiaceae bacterium]|nr:porin [Burkholderiaceae bacterium]
MTNRILALGAVAASTLLAQTAAMAQAAPSGNVTIYGLYDVAVRRATNTNAARDSNITMEDGIFTGTRWGLRGTEDLGGGLRAMFNIEAGFHPGTGQHLQGTTTADYGQEAVTNRMWGREAWVGLRGAWGGVQLGRQYTVAHTLAARFQPQGNANNTALSVFSSHHIARQDNVVRYDQKFGDVELLASYTVGGQASTSANSATAIGVGYSAGSLSLAAYLQQMNNRAGTEKRKIVGLGGNYKLNPTVALFGGVMQRSAEVSVQENKVWTLGTNIELSPASTLSLAYFDDSQSGSAALEGSRKVAWATVNYRFSRRTDIYAVVDRNEVEGGYARPAFLGTLGSQTAFSVGLRHRF